MIERSVICGVVFTVIDRGVGYRFVGLVAGAIYDLVVDYPYRGATGGTIGVFAKVAWAEGVYRVKRVAKARTAEGGICLTFRVDRLAVWHQIVFLGDHAATAVVNYYVIPHE